VTSKKSAALGITDVLKKIARRYEPKPNTKEAREDCLHLFWSAPPWYSLAEIVQWTGTISAMIKLRESFNVKRSPAGTKPGRVVILEV